MTADRVRRWQFHTTSFTRSGYDSAEVHRFRIQAADELDLLATEIAHLWAENERLAGHLELHRHGVIPSHDAAAKLPTANEVNLLSEAQREAEQIMAQAHDYAHRVAEYARTQYDKTIRTAIDSAIPEAQRATHHNRRGTGVVDADPAAERKALQVAGDAMISQIRAVARHLDDGRQQLARTLDRLAPKPTEAEVTAGAPGPAAPPPTRTAATIQSDRVRVISADAPTMALAVIDPADVKAGGASQPSSRA
ncbi:cell division protein DivIVA [Micromonospora sp. NPDC007271]|uniref:cell division protein DivIVA n=1 Tax=Micromonospora sp. NPDC007271 TaxID=3154587 RepID=UPI0033EE1AD0